MVKTSGWSYGKIRIWSASLESLVFYTKAESQFQVCKKGMDRIKTGVGGGELHDTKILVFTENLSFESASYKGTCKIFFV